MILPSERDGRFNLVTVDTFIRQLQSHTLPIKDLSFHDRSYTIESYRVGVEDVCVGVADVQGLFACKYLNSLRFLDVDLSAASSDDYVEALRYGLENNSSLSSFAFSTRRLLLLQPALKSVLASRSLTKLELYRSLHSVRDFEIVANLIKGKGLIHLSIFSGKPFERGKAIRAAQIPIFRAMEESESIASFLWEIFDEESTFDFVR